MHGERHFRDVAAEACEMRRQSRLMACLGLQQQHMRCRCDGDPPQIDAPDFARCLGIQAVAGGFHHVAARQGAQGHLRYLSESA